MLKREEAENRGTKLDSHGLSHEESVVRWKTCAYNMAGAVPDYGINLYGRPVHTSGMVELWARPGKLTTVKVGPT
jgi:hypothetical protein